MLVNSLVNAECAKHRDTCDGCKFHTDECMFGEYEEYENAFKFDFSGCSYAKINDIYDFIYKALTDKKEQRDETKTEILKIKGDWNDVINDCRSTVSKPPIDREPSKRWKEAILIAEHSPIRNIAVKWIWKAMPHWVTVHWARHKWECYISTQRSDRTGRQRDKLPQDEPQNFTGEANAQHQIDTWRKRLCFMASKETREYAEDFKRTLRGYEPELSFVLQKNCLYRGGCPELNGGCGWYKEFVRRHKDEDLSDIHRRYELAEEEFYGS